MVLGGLAELGVEAGWRMMTHIRDRTVWRTYTSKQQLDVPHLTLLMHAMAELGMRPAKELLADLSHRTANMADQLDPSHMTSLLWAFAKMGTGRRTGARLAAALSPRAAALAESFTGFEISSVLRSLAMLHAKPCTALTAVMPQRALAVAANLQPLEASNMFWGLAALGILPDGGSELQVETSLPPNLASS